LALAFVTIETQKLDPSKIRMGYDNAMQGAGVKSIRRLLVRNEIEQIEALISKIEADIDHDIWVPVKIAIDKYRSYNETGMSDAWIRGSLLDKRCHPYHARLLHPRKISNRFVVSRRALDEMSDWMWSMMIERP